MDALTTAATKKKQEKKESKLNKKPNELGPDETKQCKVFFKTFDRDGNQSLNKWELRLALEAMGQNPSNSDVDHIMSMLDTSQNGKIDYEEFVRAVMLNRTIEKKPNAEQDLIDAFIAMGGKADTTGTVSADLLRKVIKVDFELTIKIDELLDDLDSSSEGVINFEEFKNLLG